MFYKKRLIIYNKHTILWEKLLEKMEKYGL